jgi:protein SCO1/2
MERLRTPLLLALAAVLSTALFWLWFADHLQEPSHKAPLPRELEGIVLPRVQPLPEFVLHDFDGHPLTADWFHGQWTFVFFGYTHCPDICPTTLYTLQQVRRQLARTPDLLADTRFLFVTLDPQRDSAEILKGYVQHFDPGFLAARGEPATLDRLTAALNIAYAIEHSPDRSGYTINHSAAILLIDAQGRYHARYTPMQNATLIGDTYRTIRDLRHR